MLKKDQKKLRYLSLVEMLDEEMIHCVFKRRLQEKKKYDLIKAIHFISQKSYNSCQPVENKLKSIGNDTFQLEELLVQLLYEDVKIK